jgi:VCBS repeat protein
MQVRDTAPVFFRLMTNGWVVVLLVITLILTCSLSKMTQGSGNQTPMFLAESVEDLNGDGTRDLVIGIMTGSDLGTCTVSTFSGKTGRRIRNLISTPGSWCELAGGDYDSDGVTDVMLYSTDSGNETYSVVSTRTGLQMFSGTAPKQSEWEWLFSIGNVDGAPFDDFCVSYLKSGRIALFNAHGEKLLEMQSDFPCGSYGYCIRALNTNGSDYPRLVVGVPTKVNDPDCSPPFDGCVDVIDTQAGSVLFRLRCDTPDSAFGQRIQIVGDCNHDNAPDIAVGTKHGANIYSGLTGMILVTLSSHVEWPLIPDVDGDGVADYYRVDNSKSGETPPSVGITTCSGITGQALSVFSNKWEDISTMQGKATSSVVVHVDDITGDGIGDYVVALEYTGVAGTQLWAPTIVSGKSGAAVALAQMDETEREK